MTDPLPHCARCGELARGLAMVGPERFCHEGPSPTCYELASRGDCGCSEEDGKRRQCSVHFLSSLGEPVEVEAIQYQPGVNCNAVAAFLGEPGDHDPDFCAADEVWHIPIPEGGHMIASPGDWIVRTPYGCYPLKPDLFEACYRVAK